MPEANKWRKWYPHLMARCRVSFTDSDKTVHAAESLYEAVALAIADSREDHLLRDGPGPMTEFTVAVLRNPTEQKIRLNQVTKWAEHTTKERLAGITTRARVRSLLGAIENSGGSASQ